MLPTQKGGSLLRQYHELLKRVLDNGIKKEDRTETGTLSVFGYQMRFDLGEGIPLVTTKQVDYQKVLGELLWFLSGNTNANVCADEYGFKMWRKWASESGELGPVYGAQWRSWLTYGWGELKEIDQIANVIKQIRTNPDSRRLIVSAWNVGEIEDMALPPCHLLFQFYVADGKLSCQLYQRSADLFLGVPFNIASYATLIHMIAQVTDLEVGEFIHTIGDAHIYLDHIEQVKEQLKRNPIKLPTLRLNSKIRDIDDFGFDDIQLEGYYPYPAIKGEVSV